VTRIPGLLAAIAVAGMASSTFAQSDLAGRTAVSFVVGAGSTTATTGIAVGGSALFDLTDYATLEAQGTYLDRGAAARALSATGSVLVNFVAPRNTVVPYVAAGGGVYRASFDLDNPRFLGPMNTQLAPASVICPASGTGIGPGPGAGFGPGSGTCSSAAVGYWGVGQMSDFYARRLGALSIPAAGGSGSRSWVDRAVTLGGGVRFHVNEHFMVRPDTRALLVFANGNTHTLGVFGLNVGYRF